MIKLQNKKILKYLREKDLLVSEGRKFSKEIDFVQRQIDNLDKKERKITDKIAPPHLINRGESLKNQINEMVKELEKVGKAIEDAKIDAIPKEMVKRHYELRDKKEKLERERNKVALRVQKIKDRVVPLIQREVKPQLKEFEDISGAEIKNNEVLVNTYDMVEDYKKKVLEKRRV